MSALTSSIATQGWITRWFRLWLTWCVGCPQCSRSCRRWWLLWARRLYHGAPEPRSSWTWAGEPGYPVFRLVHYTVCVPRISFRSTTALTLLKQDEWIMITDYHWQAVIFSPDLSLLPASEGVGTMTSIEDATQQEVKIQSESQLEEQVLHDGWKKMRVRGTWNKTNKKKRQKQKRDSIYFCIKDTYLYIYAHVNSFMLYIWIVYMREKSITVLALSPPG